MVEDTTGMKNRLYKLQKSSAVNKMMFTTVQSITLFLFFTHTSTLPSALPTEDHCEPYKGTFGLAE